MPANSSRQGFLFYPVGTPNKKHRSPKKAAVFGASGGTAGLNNTHLAREVKNISDVCAQTAFLEWGGENSQHVVEC